MVARLRRCVGPAGFPALDRAGCLPLVVYGLAPVEAFPSFVTFQPNEKTLGGTCFGGRFLGGIYLGSALLPGLLSTPLHSAEMLPSFFAEGFCLFLFRGFLPQRGKRSQERLRSGQSTQERLFSGLFQTGQLCISTGRGRKCLFRLQNPLNRWQPNNSLGGTFVVSNPIRNPHLTHLMYT